MALGSCINFDFLHKIIQFDRRLDRLPVLLFTNIFYRLFSPMVAHYILYFFYFYLVTFLVFRIMKSILSEESAFLSAILFGTSFWILPSLGDVWITRQIIICLFLGLLFALPNTQTNKKVLFWALSGFFSGCAFFSHFATLPFLYEAPLLFLVGIIVKKEFSLKTLLKFTLLFLGGFIACFVLFGLINHLYFSGRVLFFLNQVTTSGWDYSGWAHSPKDIYSTTSNSLIIFSLAASLFSLLKKKEVDKTELIIPIWFIAAVILYGLFCYVNTFFPKSPIFTFALALDFYSLWIIPFCSIALFTSLVPKNIRPNSWCLIYGAIILFISPFGLKILSIPNLFGILKPTTTTFALLGILISVFASYDFGKWGSALAIILTLFSNMLVFHRKLKIREDGYVDKPYFSRLYEGNRFLQQLNFQTPPYSWIGENPQEYGQWSEYRSFCKLWLFEYGFIDGFPVFGNEKLTSYNPYAFKPNNTILIVDQDRGGTAVERGNKALFPYGRKLSEINRKTLGKGDYQYSMILCRVTTNLTWDSVDKSWITGYSGLPLLNNGNFEKGLEGWNGPGDCSAGAAGSAKFSNTFSDESYDGTKGKKSLFLESSNHILGLNTKVSNLQIGKLYVLKIRFKSIHSDLNGRNPKIVTRDSPWFSGMYYFYDNLGELPGMDLPMKEKLNNTADWLQMSLIFRARDSSASLYIYCPSDGTYRNSCYFDSVQVEPIHHV